VSVRRGKGIFFVYRGSRARPARVRLSAREMGFYLGSGSPELCPRSVRLSGPAPAAFR